MEEKHLPTEHLTSDMVRPCLPSTLTQAQALEERLAYKATEELFRRDNPTYAQERPRYRGICGTVGNPVFTDTPVEPPCYLRPIRTYGMIGYHEPVQHPMYVTSNADYGQQPGPEHTPVYNYPRDCTLTRVMARGGTYEDTHLTTELDRQPCSFV